MVIDFHVHVFPPAVKADRSDWLARDATFAELYASPKARIATVDDLLRSMDSAGIEVSVMQGFGWTNPDDCQRHNDVLLDASARHPERLVAFCTVNPGAGTDQATAEAERCLATGGRGLGELRPDAQGYSGQWGALGPIAVAANARQAPLLVHASEPVGHQYAGKGRLHPRALLAMVQQHPHTTWVLAHLGGGLPFYAAMPEVQEALRHTYVDTAAWPLLYGPQVFPALAATFGAKRILFGSDYPLQDQARSVERIRRLPLDAGDITSILGENAAGLLGPAGGR